MTIKEMKTAIVMHCLKTHNCSKCKLFEFVGYDECYANASDEQVKKNYAFLFEETPEEAPEETASAVDHPSHYTGEKYECIEVMREVFGDESTKNFCLLNAFKYLWRCGKKHESPVTDIKKAIWYLNKYLATKEDNA